MKEGSGDDFCCFSEQTPHSVTARARCPGARTERSFLVGEWGWGCFSGTLRWWEAFSCGCFSNPALPVFNYRARGRSPSPARPASWEKAARLILTTRTRTRSARAPEPAVPAHPLRTRNARLSSGPLTQTARVWITHLPAVKHTHTHAPGKLQRAGEDARSWEAGRSAGVGPRRRWETLSRPTTEQERHGRGR